MKRKRKHSAWFPLNANQAAARYPGARIAKPKPQDDAEIVAFLIWALEQIHNGNHGKTLH